MGSLGLLELVASEPWLYQSTLTGARMGRGCSGANNISSPAAHRHQTRGFLVEPNNLPTAHRHHSGVFRVPQHTDTVEDQYKIDTAASAAACCQRCLDDAPTCTVTMNYYGIVGRKTSTGWVIFPSSYVSSHVLIFPSSHVLILSCSHLLMFPSSHVPTFSCSHLLMFPPSHLLIFSSSHLPDSVSFTALTKVLRGA